MTRRRQGDEIQVPGNYQHVALTQGPAIQRFWHQSKLNLLHWFFTPVSGEKILDVGFGSGIFSMEMSTLGAQVIGIDANPQAVSYARQTFGKPGLEFHQGYLDEITFDEKIFDRVTCLEVIEHVYPEQVTVLLQKIRDMLRPGGLLLLTTPNYHGLWPLIEWSADRFGKTAKMDREQHINRYHRRKLVRQLLSAGFEMLQIRTYCTFAPFAAGISLRLATWLEEVERRVDLPFGNLLAVVARRPTN